MKRNILIYVVLGVFIFLSGSGDLRSEIQFKGLVQTWFSYAPEEHFEDMYGFTLRRLRLNPYGSLTKKIKWGFQIGWDKGNVSVLDAYLDFQFSPQFNLQVGQFPAPGAISSALTSSGKLDMLERPMATEYWGSINKLSSFRAIGVQASGELAKGKLYYAVMLANSSTPSFFNPSIKSSSYSHADNGLVVWTRLEWKPLDGMRIGAFMSNVEGSVTSSAITNLHVTFLSYGGHLFYEKNGFNFKAEYLAGKYGNTQPKTTYSGYSVLLGYTIHKFEPVVRYDVYTPEHIKHITMSVEKFINLTLGVNYFLDKNVKLQANYVVRDEVMGTYPVKLDNNLFYICFQYTYN